MSKKSIFMMLAVFVACIVAVIFLPKTVQAAEVTENGEYTLVLTGNYYGEDVFVDGSKQSKLIRFNFEPGETTVNVAELTKGIEVFNGETVFEGWIKRNSPNNIVNELTKDDFNLNEELNGQTYTNCCYLYAGFSNQELTETEKYYIILDGYAGEINGEDKILISQKADGFTTVDLSKYTAVRDGYKFCGWGCNGKIVTSIDKSYFTKKYTVTVTALYKSSEPYNENDEGEGIRTLILDANGGTLDGETSPKYNYIGGKDSSTSMLIFHYIPERAGYKFIGWNSKKDGYGKNYTSLYWKDWSGDSEKEFDRDTSMGDRNYYKYLTLYAVWEKIPTSDDTVKEIEAVDGIKGSITFDDGVSGEYTLEIKKMDIPDNLLDDIKYLVDINVLSGQEIVEINGIKMKIKFELPEELKGYDFYEIVYVSRNQKIKERIPATVKDGYIYFETTHLSQYGVVAKNNSQETPGGNEEIVTTPDNSGNDTEVTTPDNNDNDTEATTPSASEDNTGNPDAGDNTAMYLVLGFAALLGVGTVTFWKKFRVQ